MCCWDAPFSQLCTCCWKKCCSSTYHNDLCNPSWLKLWKCHSFRLYPENIFESLMICNLLNHMRNLFSHAVRLFLRNKIIWRSMWLCCFTLIHSDKTIIKFPTVLLQNIYESHIGFLRYCVLICCIDSELHWK